MTCSPAQVPARILARADSRVGEVVLRRRGVHTELIVNGAFVMDTVDVSTEIDLAALALRRHRNPARVLVGGLGLGFTAAAVLADPRVDLVRVVEIADPLLDWARRGLLPTDLGDDRLQLVAGDIAGALAEPADRWDLVLLDVDNGPGFLVRDDNADLYAVTGLRAAAGALAPGGTLAIWSSHRSGEVLNLLESLAAGVVDEVVREVRRDGRTLEYAIYLLTLTGPGEAATDRQRSGGMDPGGSADLVRPRIPE